jgi:Resolvase, N terminal domain
LRAEGCAKIYRERVSGARADRSELLRLLKAVAPGDVVTVTRIDRLARSTFDLFAIVKQIVDAGGQFRSLAERGISTPARRAVESNCRAQPAQSVDLTRHAPAFAAPAPPDNQPLVGVRGARLSHSSRLHHIPVYG